MSNEASLISSNGAPSLSFKRCNKETRQLRFSWNIPTRLPPDCTQICHPVVASQFTIDCGRIGAVEKCD